MYRRKLGRRGMFLSVLSVMLLPCIFYTSFYVPGSIYVSCFFLRPITSISCSEDQQLTLVFHSKLGGQALVLDVEGTWRELTGVVNKLAANLTSQVYIFSFFWIGFFVARCSSFPSTVFGPLRVFASFFCTLLSSAPCTFLPFTFNYIIFTVFVTSPPPSPFPTHARSLPISLLCLLPYSHLTMSPSLPPIIPVFPFHTMLPSRTLPPLNLELILTHLSFLGPIDRKSDESSRTWRFVQADRG